MTNRTEQEIERICDTLLSGAIGKSSLEVSFSEFQKFYSILFSKTKEIPFVSLVNLETLVKGQFSNISPQHFDITNTKSLIEEDFEFAVHKIWYGSKNRPERFLTLVSAKSG